jgi:hypothetical protein
MRLSLSSAGMPSARRTSSSTPRYGQALSASSPVNSDQTRGTRNLSNITMLCFLCVRAIVDYLKYKEGQGEGKLSWKSVICGGFFDWMLYSGMLGFDLKSRSVELIDNGTSVCTFTSLSTVGETVVKILDHADETRNQYVFTMSFQVSPRDISEVIEKVDGKKWSVHYTTCEEVIAKGRKRLDNGDFAGIMDLTRGAAFGRLALGDESKNGFWNQRLELVEDEDIEEAVRDVLRGQGMLSE